jgi:hypothetical protein
MQEQTTQQAEVAPRKRKLTWLWIALAALVIVLVAGAAFMGGRLLAGGRAMLESKRKAVDVAVVGSTEGGVGQVVSRSMQVVVSVEVTPPEVLPPRRPEAIGRVRRITGDGFILFKPEITGGVAVFDSEEGMKGQEFEIVVTRDTHVYAVEDKGAGFEADDGTLEGIQEGTQVWVWGEKRGDRIVAEVVARMRFTPPPSP